MSTVLYIVLVRVRCTRYDVRVHSRL